MKRTRGQTGNELCCYLTAFYLYLHTFIQNSNELNGHTHHRKQKARKVHKGCDIRVTYLIFCAKRAKYWHLKNHYTN